MNFINRKDALIQLDNCYSPDNAQLVIIYGRRRVGKTRLLVKFSEGKLVVFFSPPKTSGKEALGLFSERITGAFPEKGLEYTQFTSFRKAFEFLFTESEKEKIVLIIDEFPYLLEAESGVDTHLQHLWDHRSPQCRIKIILCGSVLSIMQNKVLGRNAPLYGRRTASINLSAFDFFNSRLFVPRAVKETAVLYYSIFGGIPFYLEQIDPDKTLPENVAEMVLKTSGLLYNEPYFLVQEELRDPKLYFAIMHAIASGNTRPTAIANYVGMDSNKIGKYINTLLKLELIHREIPITIKPSGRSTKGYYRVEDNFLRFWFRYVYPNSSAIELGNGKKLWENVIEPDISVFIGPVWESICRQYLARNGGAAFGFTSPIMKIGRYWEPDFEVDIVAENKNTKEVLFCECKWSHKPDIRRLLEGLKLKADSIPEYRGFKKYFGLFSRGKTLKDQPHITLDDI